MPKMIRLCCVAAMAAGFMLLFMSACAPGGAGKATDQNAYFRIISATSDEWTSGREGARGIDYTLTVRVLTTRKLQFDTLWVGKQPLAVYLARYNKPVTNGPVTFKKGDTILVRASAPLPAPQVKRNAPVAFKGAALLAYRVSGARRFQSVPAFKAANNPPRPQ